MSLSTQRSPGQGRVARTTGGYVGRGPWTLQLDLPSGAGDAKPPSRGAEAEGRALRAQPLCAGHGAAVPSHLRAPTLHSGAAHLRAGLGARHSPGEGLLDRRREAVHRADRRPWKDTRPCKLPPVWAQEAKWRTRTVLSIHLGPYAVSPQPGPGTHVRQQLRPDVGCGLPLKASGPSGLWAKTTHAALVPWGCAQWGSPSLGHAAGQCLCLVARAQGEGPGHRCNGDSVSHRSWRTAGAEAEG